MNFFQLITVVAVTTAVMVSGQCPTELTQEQKDIVLKAHNAVRQKVASGEIDGYNKAADMIEMVWNDKVAAKAQEWANKGKFEHDTSSERKITDDNNNEVNLGQSISTTVASSSPNYEEAVNKLFYDEKEDLKSANIIQKFNLENLSKYGHASQAIWAATKAVGCGTYPSTWNSQDICLLVCNYAPPGNFEGDAIYTEGDPATKCPNGGAASSQNTALCANPGGLI